MAADYISDSEVKRVRVLDADCSDYVTLEIKTEDDSVVMVPFASFDALRDHLRMATGEYEDRMLHHAMHG
jgi:hypothetical protein